MNTEERQTVYIVTGCTGYVGNVLTKKLLRDGCRVIGLARSEEKVKRIFKDAPPEIVYGDIRNRRDVEKLFKYDADYAVIHTVAYVTIGEGNKRDLFDITVQGTQNMLDAAIAHGAVKFLHISSTSAIPKGVTLNEELSNYVPCPARTNGGYSEAKSRADELVLKAAKERGLNASLLMLAIVLGPGDYGVSHMSQVMIDFKEGRLPASIDAGYNEFDIRDLAEVLPAILERSRKGDSYLFASRPDKINDILSVVAERYHKKMPPTLPM